MSGIIDVAELAELTASAASTSLARRSLGGGGGFVHREVGQAIGFLVELPAHMFERHPADAADERAGVLIERLQAGILHAVFATQLLDEQLGIRADMQ